VILVHPTLAVRLAVSPVVRLWVVTAWLLRVAVFAWVLAGWLRWLGGERDP